MAFTENTSVVVSCQMCAKYAECSKHIEDGNWEQFFLRFTLKCFVDSAPATTDWVTE